MSDLAATAERLETVKDAYGDFLALWALDCLMNEAWQSERFQRDLLNAPADEENSFLNLLSRRGLDD